MTPRKASQVAAIAGLLSSLPCLCLGQAAPDSGGQNILLPARWSVMTATDPDAARVNPKPVPTTVEKLAALPRPSALPPQGLPLPQYRATRVGAAEKTLWSVKARIVEASLGSNGSYHLTLRGASGQQIACEVPDPALTRRPSLFARRMAQARAALDARLHAAEAPKAGNVPVQITGLGYYGRIRPGAPGPPNGLQLRPVVGVSFPR